MTNKTESVPPARITEEKEFVRPPFTPLQDIKNGLLYIIYSPDGNIILMPILVLLESVLLKLIISSTSYTEIDYKAYMEQIAMIYQEGNYNYLEIRGGTGPLVYPAGHVLIYRVMNYFTNDMNNIEKGQHIFRFLYLLTLIVQYICYYTLELPPWCVVLASLSKRLHSIYVLRLFNDCFTTLFMVITVTLFSLRSKRVFGYSKIVTFLVSLTYSIAVSIKMNALLFLPGFLVSIYLISEGCLLDCFISIITLVAWQVIVALPFLKEYPNEYFKGAFDFNRQFMHKWSINWQFLDEDAFQDRVFHTVLLASHFIAIVATILFLYPRLPLDSMKSLKSPFKRILVSDNKFVVPFLLIISNFIGIIFSRSLHYQFLSWYHWTLPCLLFWSKLPMPLGVMWYLAHEYCWNSYPPNCKASVILIGLNATLLLLLAVNQMRPRITITKPKTN
ncbi:Dol-P-Man:Man(5)GlcNAc(2)-PP-Dol alpha-1,3-mannosyltransferase [Nakaseomyces bracarensis]|uniref:Dol-P-Man:Man(5)GlcNAc(2)-PP-Dol alpha-1,3-mannosyltransferase n=1 Tax=Nakaseomyces bracarensis TaxID=273131 RepID=A0ABR4NNC0_9SACH